MIDPTAVYTVKHHAKLMQHQRTLGDVAEQQRNEVCADVTAHEEGLRRGLAGVERRHLSFEYAYELRNQLIENTTLPL